MHNLSGRFFFLARVVDLAEGGKRREKRLMQRGAVECLGVCVRARVGCVTSCLPRTNVHTTTSPSVREMKVETKEIKEKKKIELSKRVIIYKSNLTGCFTTLPLLVVYELSGVVLISGSWVSELLISSSVLTGELSVASGCQDTEDSRISTRFRRTCDPFSRSTSIDRCGRTWVTFPASHLDVSGLRT